MKRCLAILIITLVGYCASPAPAAAVVGPASRPEISDPDPIETTPLLSADATWAGVMVIMIFALFMAATCIGPIIRLEKGRGE